jgi:hypothetical protein
MSSSSEAPLLLTREGSRNEAGRWWREAVEESGRLVALAAPMIAVALLQLMMQLISTVMVGHLGEVALAGAAIANSLTNVFGFSILVSSHHLLHVLPFHFLVCFFCFCIVRAIRDGIAACSWSLFCLRLSRGHCPFR